MKRKPVLFHRIKLTGNSRTKDIIGLIGTHRGVGVTYIGLMLAFYVGEELGKRTAFLECNNHHDMCLIQSSYEWSWNDDVSFGFHQITCYKEVTNTRIAEILNEDYECIILDFGDDFQLQREEFLRCGTKVIIGGRSEWEKQKLIQFAVSKEIIRGSSKWLYLIPLASDQDTFRMKCKMDRKIWPVPFTKEPTTPSKKTNLLFHQLLNFD